MHEIEAHCVELPDQPDGRTSRDGRAYDTDTEITNTVDGMRPIVSSYAPNTTIPLHRAYDLEDNQDARMSSRPGPRGLLRRGRLARGSPCLHGELIVRTGETPHVQPPHSPHRDPASKGIP